MKLTPGTVHAYASREADEGKRMAIPPQLTSDQGPARLRRPHRQQRGEMGPGSATYSQEADAQAFDDQSISKLAEELSAKVSLTNALPRSSSDSSLT